LPQALQLAAEQIAISCQGVTLTTDSTGTASFDDSDGFETPSELSWTGGGTQQRRLTQIDGLDDCDPTTQYMADFTLDLSVDLEDFIKLLQAYIQKARTGVCFN